MTERVLDFPKSVLIADDDPDLRDNLTSLLKRIAPNFVCSCAEDGKTALEMLRQQKFDLLILDLFMPKLDGKGLIESLVTVPPEFRPVHLLVISGSLSGGQRRLGKATFQPKPFSTNDIRDYLLSIYGAPATESVTRATGTLTETHIGHFSTGLSRALESLCATVATEKSRVSNLLANPSPADITATTSIGLPHMDAVCSVKMSKDTFLRLVERMLGDSHPEIVPEIQNIAAEINNQVVEYASRKINPAAKVTHLSVHTVTVGDKHTVVYFSNEEAILVQFETDVGAVALELAVLPT